MSRDRRYLTKSRYVAGLQCQKRLWLRVHEELPYEANAMRWSLHVAADGGALRHRETIDLKAYEADMRHLIDTYIEAGEPRNISPFGDTPLLELIVKSRIADAVKSLPDGIKNNRDAVAETIANNFRGKIIREHLNDPAHCDRMSKLADDARPAQPHPGETRAVDLLRGPCIGS